MKKSMSIAIAALMVTGMTAVFAGNCGGCPGEKAENKAACSADKKADCSSEKKAACSDKKDCAKEKSQEA